MINLLPSQNKKILEQEKFWRMLMILTIDFLAVLICFYLVLSVLDIYLSGEINRQEIIYQEKQKEMAVLKMQELEKNLIKFNNTFFHLDKFYQERFKAAETLNEISRMVPSEIYLTNLSINPQKKEKVIQCNLSGFAPNREILLRFKEILEEKENFQKVYFPPADWVKPKDINFTVSFEILWP